MPLFLAGISSNIGDASMRGSREAVARVPKPIRNSRRLRAPRHELRFFKTLCHTYILLRLLRCAAGGSQLRELPKASARRAYDRLKVRTAGVP
jgi:hypothetical protein